MNLKLTRWRCFFRFFFSTLKVFSVGYCCVIVRACVCLQTISENDLLIISVSETNLTLPIVFLKCVSYTQHPLQPTRIRSRNILLTINPPVMAFLPWQGGFLRYNVFLKNWKHKRHNGNIRRKLKVPLKCY